VLDVPVSFFFDDMSQDVPERSPAVDLELDDMSQGGFDADPMARRETLELVRAYYRIKDPIVRKRVFELAKALANVNDGD
jgi:hypothetical protein